MTRPALRATFISVLTLLLLGGGWPAQAVEHPTDLRQFLERREECDHWRGEAGYDKARQADIDRGVCRTCTGTDAELARLRKKYRANPGVMDVLDELEDRIEGPDKAASTRFCRRMQKPKPP
ncbi:hypothetical protein ACFJGX_06930 [Hydrogenophaga sp. UC242_50]|uniref:hypothetical protein n=1 Tax=unclassified Hydrogenophaga TaxID=2610897 RepID=UPI0036D3CD10